MWIPPFILGLVFGVFITLLLSSKKKKESTGQEEELIEEHQVEVGQLWIDRDWKDTIIKVVQVHDSKPLFRYVYTEIDGSPQDREDTSAPDSEMTIDRWFFKNWRLLKEAE